MATIIQAKHSEGAVNAGEKRLLTFLEVNLPEGYFIIPNVEFSNATPRGQVQYLEYDCIVVTPHALYHIENKDWSGQLEGDDNNWYLNGSEKANPLKTVRFKTSVLASKLKQHNPSWSTAWVASLLTLSHPRQSKHGLYGDCAQASYLLDNKLIEFIKNAEAVSKRDNCIADIYVQISKANKARTEIKGYDIIETLTQDTNFTEYLCKAKGLITANKKRIKEYILDLAGLSPADRERRENQIKNQYNALNQIKNCPFILNVQFDFDEEHQRFYEITDYLDESSLRAELRRKTFTQEETLNIVFNIIEALKVAHDANVFHRDLNPENIYLTNGYAALGNFGKSYFADHGNLGYTVAVTIDKSNATAYHAFELLAKDASRASDIYSLGVLIYELFTRKLPFNSPFEFNNLGGKLPDNLLPTAINPALPTWLNELCNHTILISEDNRWDNIFELEQFIKDSISQSQVPQKIEKTLYSFEELKPGSRIVDFILFEELGKGGYSRVFKARQSIMDKDFAIKIFNESATSNTVIDEYKALSKLQNKNIVKFVFNGTLPNGQFYTLMEFLDGENLYKYTKGDLKLPLQQVKNVGIDVLNALVEMQSQKPKPLFHRDIKPQNIVWDKQERFVLIDFNVASVESDKNFVGTNPYLAPDLVVSSVKVNWDSSADTFALGITLYELACGNYPWAGNRQPRKDVLPTNPQIHNELISDSFADFLIKSVSYSKKDRFSNANEMISALQAVPEIIKESYLKEREELQPTGNDDENFVDYLNSLYSQSRYGNAGTRAGHIQSNFDKLTYTPTKLDTKLLNAIIDGSYRLVIVTGNAGDGKTAFIKQIEEKAINVKRLNNRNGAEFTINGKKYISNYDGSQDEEERANDDVLSDFFRPFEEATNYLNVNEGRIIAINEGRLVDFLQSSGKFKHLEDIIDEYFYKEGHSPLPQGLMIINLNLRSVTAKGENGDSLFRNQIKKLTNQNLWTNCNNCSQKEHCFIKYNVDTLTDSAAGDEVINRIEWLVRTISYKRELHITMRDLRSFLAFLISHDCTCKDVESLFKKYQDEPEKYWQYYYFNITSSNNAGTGDRLIKLLRETDIAEVAIPNIDRDLYFGLHQPKEFLLFADRTQSLLDSFNKHKMLSPAYEQTQNYVTTLKLRHQTYIRHQYFEGNFSFFNRIPYHSLRNFHSILNLTGNDFEVKIAEAKQNLAYAISASEGCSNTQLSNNHLILSSARVNDPISKSYRRFHLDEFEMVVNKTDQLVQYIEYESDSLLFKYKEDRNIQISISLDLFEMLHFIQQGYSPSLNDLRGRFVELQVFKNLLENKIYNEVIVTKNNKDFHVISLERTSNKLILSALKVN
jgi:serine/threonine protein kinase